MILASIMVSVTPGLFFKNLYATIAGAGFTYPLHPIVIHLPIGLIVGAFLFAVISAIFQRFNLALSAKHCILLAFLAMFPAIALGYGDWRYFHGGAWSFEIKMKIFLAVLLTVLLLLLVLLNAKRTEIPLNHLPLYALVVLIVTGIGLMGAELVFGEKRGAGAAAWKQLSDVNGGLVRRGAGIFGQRCAFCHYSDRTDTNIGPGLKGLFSSEQFAVSRLPANRASLQRQLSTPHKDMAAFDQMSKEDINALAAYLETL